MLRLETGDRVAIIAPASHQRRGTESLIDKAAAVLASWGLQVSVLASEFRRHLYLAGDDDSRAAELNGVLRDPQIRAVFVTRGGYGSARLLKRIDWSLKPTPRILCGFSDISTLAIALGKYFPTVEPVYGPNLATNQFLSDTSEARLTRSRLREALFCPDQKVVEDISIVRGGSAAGALAGGCLSMVTALLGTPFEPDFDDAIVFLEDVGEKPYRIDRMITQLLLSGKLTRARAIVFGEMRGCGDSPQDLLDTLSDVFAEDSMPVAIGVRSGHGSVNLSLRMGQPAVLDGKSCTVTFG